MAIIKRINIFGGAGVGKSTMTTKLFAELKSKHYNIELVTEYIKNWVYESRTPTSWDQFYILGKQLHGEDLIIRSGPIIITDSPLLMQTAYAKYNDFPAIDELVSIIDKFDEYYPSLNFLLRRKHEFVQTGRFYTKEVSEIIENNIIELLCERKDKIKIFMDDLSYEEILEIIMQHIER